jgi:hypothetical protein
LTSLLRPPLVSKSGFLRLPESTNIRSPLFIVAYGWNLLMKH